MNNAIHALWLQYLGEKRVDESKKVVGFDNPDVHRLRRIAEAEHRLINPSEGVHFEGDG
jgi:hypothetical protein